jgi:NO-binding membrane sensor protein with MHYT domain
MQPYEPTWNVSLIVLSYVISVFGSYVALQWATRIPEARGRSLWWWTAGGALALGGGAIWSMHFIGMLAYRIALPISYDPLITLASLVLAVVVCAAALAVVGRGARSVTKLALGGLLAGLGVAGMHYTGMAAMHVAGAEMRYVGWIVAVSILIAVLAASAALWLAFNLRNAWQRIASAFVMGLAVCGMHYTGMAAMILRAAPNQSPRLALDSGLQWRDLGFSVFLTTFVILALALVMALGEADKQTDANDPA